MSKKPIRAENLKRRSQDPTKATTPKIEIKRNDGPHAWGLVCDPFRG
jgi:hypothetical protein